MDGVTHTDWLDMLLCRWGRWSVKRESSALGYGSVSPMFKDARVDGDGYGSEFDPGFTSQDVLSCDAAVNRLPLEHRRVVIVHYRNQGGIRRTARELGCNFHKARDLLNYAHGFLHVLLDKRDADHQNTQ